MVGNHEGVTARGCHQIHLCCSSLFYGRSRNVSSGWSTAPKGYFFSNKMEPHNGVTNNKSTRRNNLTATDSVLYLVRRRYVQWSLGCRAFFNNRPGIGKMAGTSRRPLLNGFPNAHQILLLPETNERYFNKDRNSPN